MAFPVLQRRTNGSTALFAVLTALLLVLSSSGGPSTTIRPVASPPGARAYRVPGESYEICNEPGYLTSSWSYNRLKKGSHTYTVAQYEALPGYGSTLPTLPSYIASERPSTKAATIFAPGSSANWPSYDETNTMLLYFEGGLYNGRVGGELTSGDIIYGGSAPGYPEPEATAGGGFSAQNDHWNDQPGYGQLAARANNSMTLNVAPSTFFSGSYNTNIVFADRHSAPVSRISGNTITLNSPVTEPAGENFWLVGDWQVMATTTAAATQGATTLSTTADQLNVDFVPGEKLSVTSTLPDGEAYVEPVQVSSVSASGSGGVQLNLVQPLAQAVPAGADVIYDGDAAADVTIEYLNIGNDNGGVVIPENGSYWTIEHNYIHDDYAGGTNYASTNAAGQAIEGADHATIEYNCFQRLGEYALNGGGVGTVFDYNQVDETPYNPDLSGNGQTGCGKWWGTTNNDVVDNAFTDEFRSACIWFDNGNTGMLVQGNYFYEIDGTAVGNETGYNSEYIGNLFQDVASAIYFNDSGGWDIPGSRFNNEALVESNTFDNVLQAIGIWGASGRSCLNSGEQSGAESDPYCSGGSPQVGILDPTQQYFSHYYDASLGNWGEPTVVGNEDCSTSSPCSTLTLSSAPAINDWIGFADLAPDDCGSSNSCSSAGSYLATTTTSDTTNVASFSGSGTINVASTTGFPSSGQLLVSTSCGTLYLSTGAVVSYTGTTPTSFTGVSLVSGCGTLTSSGPIVAVQPYHITAVSCPGGNCTDNAVVSVSPPVTAPLADGTQAYFTGTCPYYDTATATPSSPTAPDGTSYYDGCMWEDRNITIESNTFVVDPQAFDSTPLPTGDTSNSSGNWSCVTGPGGNCAQEAMGYQYPGGDAVPYNSPVLSNAMMSSPSLPAPLDNLNASGSPLATSANGAASPNGQQPYDDTWASNSYQGDWTFQAYVQAAACPVNWTGSSLAWASYDGGGDACSGLSLAQWRQYWGQD